MKETFDKARPILLKHEGGYVDHPTDPGGATNHGVTIGTLAAWRGHKVTKTDVRNLTVDEAVLIFKKNYWDRVHGDDLPAGIDYAVYDFAVNSGPGRAAKELQRIVGVPQDNVIGLQTLAAVAKYCREKSASALINTYCDRRLRFMKGLRGGKLWRTFGGGWARRVADVRKHAVAFAAATRIDMGAERPGRGKAYEGEADTARPGAAAFGGGAAGAALLIQWPQLWPWVATAALVACAGYALWRVIRRAPGGA